jgi:hypothetical protein
MYDVSLSHYILHTRRIRFTLQTQLYEVAKPKSLLVPGCKYYQYYGLLYISVTYVSILVTSVLYLLPYLAVSAICP